MQIDTTIRSDYDLICIIVEGECNHASVHTEMFDCGYPDPIKCDYVDNDQLGLVCDKCGAWRMSEDDPWEGLTFLPMVYSPNTGQLIMDIKPQKPRKVIVKEYDDVA